MKQLTASQRKIILGVGIFAVIAAIVTVGISIGRGSGFPISTPLLLVVVGAILIMLANKNRDLNM